MISSLLYLYMFLLPFSDVYVLNYRIGVINISILEIVILLLMIFIIQRNLVKCKNLFAMPAGICWLFIFLLLCSSISMAWTFESKYDIKISLNFLEGFFLFIVFTTAMNDERSLKGILIATLIGSTCYNCITLIHSLGLNLPAYHRHITTNIGPFSLGGMPLLDSPIPFDLTILAAYPIIFHSKIIKNKALQVALFCMLSMAAIISLTRSLWLAMLFQIGLAYYLAIFKKYNTTKKILLIMTLISFLIALYTTVYDDFINMRKDTTEHRVLGYILAIKLATDSLCNFLFGAGKGTFVHQFYTLTGREGVVHNLFLDVLAAKGILTLIPLCLVIFTSYRSMATLDKVSPRLESAARHRVTVQLIVAGMLVDGLLLPLANSTPFWSFLALSYATRSLPAPREKVPWRIHQTSYLHSWAAHESR